MAPNIPRNREVSRVRSVNFFSGGLSVLPRIALIVFAIGCYATSGAAQPVVMPQGLSPEQAKKFQEQMKNRGNRGAQPNQPNKDQKKDDKNKGEEKKEESKPDDTKTIKRPTDRPTEFDPNRIKLRADKDGLVQFNYRGQPWTDVLEDYADAAGFTLDWMELPADFLNLTTRRKYTLQEARDVLNQHLLARGFTMLNRGEMLSVAKLSNLDPSLVPKVLPDSLEDHAPYDFVRVQFKLPPTMDPAKAAEDVKLLLSPNAKVHPLLASKRLLVIDIVANLRSVRDLLYAEQMASASDIRPHFFRIKNRRADFIADQVMIILGLDPASRKAPKTPRMDPKQMQMMMQMQQKGQDVSKLMNSGAPKVYVAVDQKHNIVLVNAPEDKFPQIERTIKILDVGNRTNEAESFDDGQFTMERYKTLTASTDSIITALTEIGDLDPLTQLKSDSKSKTIFAYATSRDHNTIKQMIGKLDGSGRHAEVIWLPRNLPADQVAGTLNALIGGFEEEEEEDDFPWYYFRGRDNDKDDKKSKFSANPDIENNRLILWASDDELAEVHLVIDKLERNPDGTKGDNRTVRRFRAQDPEDMQKLLEKLEATWPGDNKLEIEIEPAETEQNEQPSEANTDTEDDRLTGTFRSTFRLVQTFVGEEQAVGEEPPQEAKEPAPIKITVNSEGELVIASKDTQALDQIQKILESFTPAEPEFHYFKLKYVYADDVVYNLEKYFEDAMAEDGESTRDWWGRRVETKPDPGPLTLGRRRPLRIIDDYRTNTVIVANASPSQLKTIKEIIEKYDVPRKTEDYRMRKTEVVQVKYSRASDIAESLKAVYVDLLSSKDKSFQDKDGKSTSSYTESNNYVFEDIEKVRRTEYPVVISFAGVLSVGVDEVSNSLIVCARRELMPSIIETIGKLDEAAKPKTVVVTHEVRGMLDAETIQQALNSALSTPWPGGKPLQPGQTKQSNGKAQQKNQQQNENRESQRRGR